jgi:hypothetical protein
VEFFEESRDFGFVLMWLEGTVSELDVETGDVPVWDLIHVLHFGAPNSIALRVWFLSGSEGSVVVLVVSTMVFIRGGSTTVFVRGEPGSRGQIGCWKLCMEIMHDDQREEFG